MFTSKTTKRFDASLKLCIKRNYNIEQFKEIAKLLLAGKQLPKRCKPHKLQGNFVNCWECHIKPDWLLIYRYDYKKQQIIFEDTGTHSDLF